MKNRVAQYRYDHIGETFSTERSDIVGGSSRIGRMGQADPFRLGHTTPSERWANSQTGSASFEAEPFDSVVARLAHEAVKPMPCFHGRFSLQSTRYRNGAYSENPESRRCELSTKIQGAGADAGTHRHTIGGVQGVAGISHDQGREYSLRMVIDLKEEQWDPGKILLDRDRAGLSVCEVPARNTQGRHIPQGSVFHSQG